jgi:hypothetical protein
VDCDSADDANDTTDAEPYGEVSGGFCCRVLPY